MLKLFFIVSIYMYSSLLFSKEVIVIDDNGLIYTKSEMEETIKTWDLKVQNKIKEDKAFREEMLGRLMINKKLAEAYDKIPIEEGENEEFYWKSHFAIRNLKAKLFQQYTFENMELPDFTQLAKERFLVDKDTFSKVPERRSSSHILIICDPKSCNQQEKKKQAEQVLSELKDGADFKELVVKYSEDPISKVKNGKIEKWVARSDKSFLKPYLVGLFAIKKVGTYSDIVSTQFGFHIIRLDGIKKESFRSFEEAREDIIKVLTKHFKDLYANAMSVHYLPSKEAKYNDKVLDELFLQSQKDKK